jgi:hypothetical protein
LDAWRVPIRYFNQLAFSQVFSRANPGIVDERRLKTRAAQEIKLGNVSTRPIIDREALASILCEGPSSFSSGVMMSATGGAEVRIESWCRRTYLQNQKVHCLSVSKREKFPAI